MYNLNEIKHHDVDPDTGKVNVDCLTKNWSPVLTLKTIIYVLKVFVIGTLGDDEPQEILYKGED